MIAVKGGTTELIPKPIKQLMLDAWNRHQWIYDQLDKKWYTPEEFKAMWKVLAIERNLSRYVVRSPEMGIAESLEGMRLALERAEELQRKLLRYYEWRLERRR